MFPIDVLDAGPTAARVRLEGGLPGTRITAGLVSSEARISFEDERPRSFQPRPGFP